MGSKSQQKGTMIRIHPDTRAQLDAIAKMKRIRISQAVHLAVHALYEELNRSSPVKIEHNANKR